MKQISVAEAARELKMEEPEFLKKLREMGVYAEDAFSTFRREDFERIKTILRSEGAGASDAIEETRLSRTVIRRRAKRPAPPAQMPAAETPKVEVQRAEREPRAEAEPIAPAPEPVVAEAPAPSVEVSPEPAPAVEATTAPPPEVPPVGEGEPATAAEVPPPSTETVETPPAAEAAPAVAPSAPEAVARKKPDVQPLTPKRVQVKGTTREPARILEKLSPESLFARRGAPPAAPGREAPRSGVRPVPGVIEAPAARHKKGRTVVEVVSQESAGGALGGRRKGGKRREIELREMRFDRRERIFGDLKRPRPRDAAEARKAGEAPVRVAKRTVKLAESVTVGDLAKRMGVKSSEVIRYLMLNLGSMMTVNQSLDRDTATIVAAEFGFDVESATVDESEYLQIEEDRPEDRRPRHPVVTIMGHVDHGKTSLLEAIRKVDDMLSREAGGITQHIGAYNVRTDKGRITFLDTPGHEAFTQMRARGAQVTDIVVLVVAADDGVMPQTKEAINHAKAAGVPIIVAINKIDKPEANPERIKQDLTEFALVPEAWGGSTQYVEVSAKMGTNIEDLLDAILVQAEVLELRANEKKRAEGVVIEAKLERGRGPVATVLVRDGTLRAGDSIVAGPFMGRVRMMNDHRGRRVDEAGPSMAVEVVGLSGVPQAGDPFNVVPDERTARQIVELRQSAQKVKETAKQARVTYKDLHEMIASGEIQELNLVLKADVQGSIEAIAESLQKQSTEAVKVNIIHSSVGAISETDVNLASASNAIIIGFNVRPNPAAAQAAEQEGVEIKLYTVIYDVVNDVRAAMAGLLAPQLVETTLGRAEVRNTFTISKVGTIAGSFVADGKIRRGAKARLVRDGTVVVETRISSLRRFKDDVKEVVQGLECGIGLENYNDVKIGDVIEAFEVEEVAAEL